MFAGILILKYATNCTDNQVSSQLSQLADDLATLILSGNTANNFGDIDFAACEYTGVKSGKKEDGSKSKCRT